MNQKMHFSDKKYHIRITKKKLLVFFLAISYSEITVFIFKVEPFAESFLASSLM